MQYVENSRPKTKSLSLFAMSLQDIAVTRGDSGAAHTGESPAARRGLQLTLVNCAAKREVNRRENEILEIIVLALSHVQVPANSCGNLIPPSGCLFLKFLHCTPDVNLLLLSSPCPIEADELLTLSHSRRRTSSCRKRPDNMQRCLFSSPPVQTSVTSLKVCCSLSDLFHMPVRERKK